MRRRDFLGLFTCGAVYAPIAAFSQQAAQLRVIGVLIAIAESDPEASRRIAAFQAGLDELGWRERRNVRIVYRLGSERDQLQRAARELVALRPDVIVASSSTVTSVILRETRTIPVVFVTASDPIGDGFVASLARPAGNATGFTHSLATVGGKWLELLKEISPGVSRVAVLFNRDTAPTGGAYFLQPIMAAAPSFGMRPFATPVHDTPQIESVLADFAREPGGSLIVMPDPFTTVNREVIIAQASRHSLTAIYPFRHFVTAGGLMSYGADLIDLYRRTPTYVDRILRGTNPADLPVQAPAKFELVVNLKAAKLLGLTAPRILLARADEVIE
jgi:putative ABC transport system substrate-binding protein